MVESDAWLDAVMFEAKVVRRGNATAAVREAIGQLHTYPALVVPKEDRPGLRRAALFSEYVGELWQELLEHELGIAVVWWTGDAWAGGTLARQWSLADDVEG